MSLWLQLPLYRYGFFSKDTMRFIEWLGGFKKCSCTSYWREVTTVAETERGKLHHEVPNDIKEEAAAE